jgi:hypothetical protein
VIFVEPLKVPDELEQPVDDPVKEPAPAKK